jgi:hypothetical protein
LICALSAEILPNWCRHLQIEWSDIILDIVEWMQKINHPNLIDFESCVKILLEAGEQEQEQEVEEEEVREEEVREEKAGENENTKKVPRSPIEEIEIQQARRWINTAFFVWTQEPTMILPSAWFILEDMDYGYTEANPTNTEANPTNTAEAHDNYLGWLSAAKEFAEKRGFEADFKTADELSRLLVPWLNENKDEANAGEFAVVLEKLAETRRLVEEFAKKEMDPSRFKAGDWVTAFDGEVHGPYETHEAALESVQSAKFAPSALTWQIS